MKVLKGRISMEVEEADPKKNYNVRSYLKSYSQLNRSIYWRNRK
jgi:hypothetical protein